jgi:hypothetical protein
VVSLKFKIFLPLRGQDVVIQAENAKKQLVEKIANL